MCVWGGHGCGSDPPWGLREGPPFLSRWEAVISTPVGSREALDGRSRVLM